MLRLCNQLGAEAIYKIDLQLMRRFIEMGELCEYCNKELVGKPNSVDSNIYIVVDGILRVWYWNGDKEVTDSFACAGTMMIYYHSYLYNLPPHYYFDVCGKTRILRITKADFDNLIYSEHQFALWVLSYSQCQIYYDTYKSQVINGNVLERYRAIEKNRPEIIKKVPMKVIASYLNVTPQHLSYIRKQKEDFEGRK